MSDNSADLQLIHQMMTAVNQANSLDEIMQLTCETAVSLFQVDHSGLVVFEQDGAHGEVVAEYPDFGAKGTRIPINGVTAEETLLQTKRPLILTDVAQSKSLGPVRKMLTHLNIKSILIVPLLVNGDVFGSFSLDMIGRTRQFSERDVDLCLIFATQVGTAVANTHFLAQTTQHLAQFERLHQSSMDLVTKIDQAKLLHAIIGHAIALLNAKSGGIYEYDNLNHILTHKADYSREEMMQGVTLKLGEGAAGRLIAEGEPYLIVSNYDQWPNRADVYQGKQFFGSVVEVPLRSDGRIIGVLYVDDDVTRQFTPADARLLQLFADQAGTVLQKAELVQGDTGKLNRLEQLTQASSEIMGQLGSLSLRDILDLIAQHAANILDAEACSICLVKRDGYLRFEACYGYTDNGIQIGREFPIRTGDKTGLTGHIAHQGQLFNAHGDALVKHPAVKGEERPYTASRQCYSMLALPLKKRQPDGEETLVGLLRVDNKRDSSGQCNPSLFFERQDEWVVKLFAETAVVAIESAAMLEALNEQKDHFQRILSNAPNCVIANAVNGDIFFFNNQAQALLGYTPEEIVGKSVLSIYPEPDDARQILRRLHKAGGPLTNIETTVISKTGERIPIRLSATRLFDASGKIIGAVGYFEDLRTIRETQRRLEWLFTANRVVTQAKNLPEGLQKLAETILHLFAPTICYILTVDEDDARLLTQAAASAALRQCADPLALYKADFSVAAWPEFAALLQTMGPTVVDSKDGWHPELLIRIPQTVGFKGQLKSLLMIPLRAGDRVVGLMCLGDLPAAAMPNEVDLMQLLVAIADQTAVLIDRMLSHEITRRHSRLLATLDETSRHLRAEKEIAQLWQEMLRLAVELAGCSAGGILTNRPQLGEMVVTAVHELPQQLLGKTLTHHDGLLGDVARLGEIKFTNEYKQWPKPDTLLAGFDFETVVGLPLYQDGQVKAVLFVTDTVRWHRVTRTDLDVLERFATHAAITLRTAGLIGSEQRMYAQLAILHQISNYIQATDDLEKILHAVLTGVTAGYGLGFNRALLLLVDTDRKQLVGRMGIGHYLITLAQADWTQDAEADLDDFRAYLQRLERGELALTPVGQQIRQLKLQIDTAVSDPLSAVVIQKQCLLVLPEQFDSLPRPFLSAFEPETPIVLVPLVVRDELIGMFVADNKFSHVPITHESMEHLLTFANTAAIAIDKTRLYNQAKLAHQKLHLFYEGSNTLVSSQPLSKVVRNIVNKTCETANASWVSLLLQNDQGRLVKVETATLKPDFHPTFTIRENGLSMQVMHTGQEMIIEDVEEWKNRVNMSLFHNGVAAAACLPLHVRNKRLGVMWIHYDEKRPFPELEREALRLFVNQVAIAYDAARRMEEMDRMRRAAEALASSAHLSDVMQQIVESARAILFAEEVSIWAYDDTRGLYLLNESLPNRSDSAIWEAFRAKAPRPKGMAHKVMKSGWMGIPNVADVEEDSFLSAETRALLLQIGVQSFQCVALTVGEEKLGILYINYPEPRIFDEEAEETARTFATHAALSLKKARLFEGLRKARSTARILSSVTTLEELGTTLSSVVEGTMDALQADAVVLFVYEENRGMLVHPPTMLGVRYPHLAMNSANVMKNEFVVDLLQREEMYIADHVQTDHLFANRRFAIDEQIASCVAVPLRVEPTRVGVMFINYRKVHRFTGDDLENIELFANQAAVAIYNAQLYQREQRRTFALKALYNASQATTVSLNLDNILRQIVEQAWHMVNYQDTQISYASIWRVIDETQARLVATFPPEAFQQTKNKLGDVVDWHVGQNGRIGIMGRALHSGKTELVWDVTQDPDYLETQGNTRSEVVVPINLGNNVIGVINVEHGDYNAFDDENIRALESLAAQAGIAIQNAGLFETAVDHAKLLDAAAQVASHAITILDEDVLLRETTRLISDRLGFYHTAVFLLDEPGEYAELRAATSDGGTAMLEKRHFLRVGEDGIVGLVAKTGEHYLTPDVDLDSRHLINPYLPDTRSEMTFPLIARGKVIGVLDVQSRHLISLSEQEIAALETMANQLANAIMNAQLYSDLQKRAAALSALYEAGQSITRSLDRDQVLAAIVEQAWKLTGTYGPTALFSCIVMVNDRYLDFVAAYPPAHLEELQERIGHIDLNGSERTGIMGQAVITGRPQLVGDVSINKNYLKYELTICSELAVPIKRGDEVIGVINVEHPEWNAFDLDDQKSLLALATQASAAIDMAQSYQELKETYQALQHTNRLVRARTAVAWMGMASSIWRHDIANHAVVIKEQAQLLRLAVGRSKSPSPEYIDKGLEVITRLAGKIYDKPITLPLSAEEGIDSVSVNALVEERARQLWQNDPYRAAELKFELQTEDDVTILVSSEWFRRAFDILIDNAVEAMETCEIKRVIVRTQVIAEGAEVAVIDTGPGLPEAIRRKIGIEHIEKPEDATGLGMGLLMAQMIVQAYGGEIKVGATGPKGTTMLISMPTKKKE